MLDYVARAVKSTGYILFILIILCIIKWIYIVKSERQGQIRRVHMMRIRNEEVMNRYGRFHSDSCLRLCCQERSSESIAIIFLCFKETFSGVRQIRLSHKRVLVRLEAAQEGKVMGTTPNL